MGENIEKYDIVNAEGYVGYGVGVVVSVIRFWHTNYSLINS